MKNNTLSPLFLQAVVGPFPSINSVGSATPLHIYNPNKTAMLIDQIRFSFRDQNVIPTRYYTAIAVEVLLGSIPLTNKHVTLGALAPRYIGYTTEIGNEDGPQGDGSLTWHFPKPLYVPPLVQLAINVRRQEAYPGESGQPTIEAMPISVVGRSLPDDYPIPSTIEVPWVTETKTNTTSTSFVSTDSDLVNSNNVPLKVTQFVGINFNEFGDGPTDAFLTVQMSLSNGTMLIRDAIPFFLAFPADRGILEVNAKLQPGEFVRCELGIDIPPAGASSEENEVGFTAVAMHGYREIQTPGTLG